MSWPRHAAVGTEGAGEKKAVSACVICGHRAVWHHDDRGCQYHGNSAGGRCPCRRTSDQVVARIIHEAIIQAAAPWMDASVTGRVTPPAQDGTP